MGHLFIVFFTHFMYKVPQFQTSFVYIYCQAKCPFARLSDRLQSVFCIIYQAYSIRNLIGTQFEIPST